MRKVISLLAVFLLTAGLLVHYRDIAAAHPVPSPECDFMTGGGFIIAAGATKGGFPEGTRMNFGAHGGCKKVDAARTSTTLRNGQTITQPNGFFWGNVNYLDHQLTPALHMHGESKAVIGYLCGEVGCPPPPERETCGFGYIVKGGLVSSDSGLSLWVDGETVLYRWAGRDVREPGRGADQFGIRIHHTTSDASGELVADTSRDSYLLRTGGKPAGQTVRTLEGGNIQHHKPNPSTITGQTGDDFLCRGAASPDF